MSSFDLRGDGRVALVTGGAGGIGKAVAEVFGEAGYHLVIADLNANESARTAGELRDAGIEVEVIVGNIADEDCAAAAVKAGLERWQRLDFVFNNAGIVGHATPIDQLTGGELERILAVDLKAPFYVCKHAVPAMREAGGGTILNVASITALTGSAYYTAYGAAKAGVISLTCGLARNLGRFNIRVNCLSPGSIAGTDLMRDYYVTHPQARHQDQLALMKKIPIGRQGRPRDVAHVALFLASPLAAHIHGAILTVDGGESLGFQ